MVQKLFKIMPNKLVIANLLKFVWAVVAKVGVEDGFSEAVNVVTVMITVLSVNHRLWSIVHK